MKTTSTLIRYFLSIAFCITTAYSHAATVRAIQSGNWESTSSWQHGTLPANGDSIIIPTGKTIRVTTQLDFSGGVPMHLVISGELTFQTGKKLTLPTGSFITLQIDGTISPGNGNGNSNTITIGVVMIWNAGIGTISGYQVLPASALPVNLIEFSAQASNQDGVLINWETATEVNNDYFDVEHSKNGDAFVTIGTVEGHGNSPVGFKYSFTHESPDNGENYYRLRQVDFNNKFHYSTIIRFKANISKSTAINLFPNPSNGDVFITVPATSKSISIHVLITDTRAKIILDKEHNIVDGTGKIKICGNENSLKPGIYIVTVTINEESVKQKLVVY